MASLESVTATLSASMKSIGTAVTMAGVGFYLHYRNFVTKEGKRTLALMSQKVTFPLYFMTKICFCNQDWSDKPCPDVTSTLHDTWALLLWPFFMVGTGLLVGKIVIRLTNTPTRQASSVLAAIAFANNTTLPITLLAVVRANFPSDSDLGHIDPTLFLSVYLVTYPILQWSLGGWILTPDDDEKDEKSVVLSVAESFKRIIHHPKSTPAHYRNVLNNKEMVMARNLRTKGLTSSDEGCYMTELDLKRMGDDAEEAEEYFRRNRHFKLNTLNKLKAESALTWETPKYHRQQSSLSSGKCDDEETCPLMESPGYRYDECLGKEAGINIVDELPPLMPASPGITYGGINKSQRTLASHYETDNLWETIKNVLDRTLFQPPVIGALLGILCAVTPARGSFVDLVNRHSGAPLQWFFDGLYKVGGLAVPDNMLILGCNLSASFQSFMEARKKANGKVSAFSRKTIVGIVVGKLIVMPIIGIGTVWILKNYVLDIPKEIAGAFYLVLMIVFLTPTANNVMIMIELGDCGKEVLEGVAGVIFVQYAVCPIFLTLTMTVAIGIASDWS
uniref:Auxin efflux carrier n=1 Tax=Amphora coffeiformis TaxID=265554 RepID=A0A7S3LDP2_9STRA|mmetsp:Transcript_16753/g.31878  ORF Transcript_16753/g.31878 Transcript_16753/m.31878 type:complete len:561 (+) Transcript_16753:93-1775(+)